MLAYQIGSYGSSYYLASTVADNGAVVLRLYCVWLSVAVILRRLRLRIMTASVLKVTSCRHTKETLIFFFPIETQPLVVEDGRVTERGHDCRNRLKKKWS